MLSANVEQRVNIKLLTKLENLPQTLTICWHKCMVISVYLARKFSSGLRSLRRVGNTSGTIQNRAVLPLRKLKRMWRRSLELFEETADWAFEQFLNLPTSIRKVLDRFCTKIWAWKRCVLKWCQKSLPPSKRNIDWIAVLTLLKKFENYPDFFLNIIMCLKLGFFNMIKRLRDNPCIEGASNPLGRRQRAWASPNSKQWLLFISISGGLSILIRCLKVRLSIRFIIKMFWRPSVNVCDEGHQTCGRFFLCYYASDLLLLILLHFLCIFLIPNYLVMFFSFMVILLLFLLHYSF